MRARKLTLLAETGPCRCYISLLRQGPETGPCRYYIRSQSNGRSVGRTAPSKTQGLPFLTAKLTYHAPPLRILHPVSPVYPERSMCAVMQGPVEIELTPDQVSHVPGCGRLGLMLRLPRNQDDTLDNTWDMCAASMSNKHVKVRDWWLKPSAAVPSSHASKHRHCSDSSCWSDQRKCVSGMLRTAHTCLTHVCV